MTQPVRAESADWLGLEERVCVVTGGGSGIGAETARQLGLAGARVAIIDRDENAAADVAAEIERKGGRSIGITADVTDAESISVAAMRVERELGACQVLVNNAAILSTDAVMKLALEKWNRLVAVNLTGALICVQIFARQMIAARRSGSIVNIASIAGKHPMHLGGGYSVSKAGLMMLSRVLSLELAQHGIRSNVIAPALVRTPFSEFVYQDPELVRRREQMIPVGRISTPLDVANTVLFMASDRSGYINGQEIQVDGGLGQTLMGLVPRPTSVAAPTVHLDDCND
ncbi:NAD(P)-dependent dehydrogenase, short-chain alcohol dehydrogenase family [Burkholderia sp. YR290]|nr:NAD(P)-dependent dehydrogenase, short-chain alcohol dehydrogenase family [Burkholderia sp. YR290]